MTTVSREGLLTKLAGAIERGQCGDMWDMIGISEADHERLPSLLRSLSASRGQLLEGLIQDAISTLHHDTTDGSDVDKYERECLRKKFSARLAAKPADDDVREAKIVECIEMAQSRLRAAMMGDEPCKPCIDLAASYLQEAITALSTKAKP